MLSFIFLSDGPCNESSWHVNDDKKQWWSRRDALARIIACSLWRSPAHWNGVVGDASLLFHVKDGKPEVAEQLSGSYSNPVVVHCGKELSKRLNVPTERNLLKLWKEAFTKAENGRLELCIGGSFLENGILCSNEPWKEQLLMNRSSSASTTTIDTSKMDKRELLVLLQKNCDVDFLRKHGLNGSEALILKKKNRDSVLKAFTDWNAGRSSSPYQESVKPARDATPSATSYNRLVATCTVLLGGILQRAAGKTAAVGPDARQLPTGYLLFLHEDYPDELNVFTPNRAQGEQRQVPIVCAMGAVRDALDVEVSALIAAATSLGMRVVGANLGRTAEFTSKIVTALVHHAVAGVLNAAVAALPAVNSSRPSGLQADSMKVIHKLAPVRKGGWTWDGKSNKTTSDRKRKYSPEHTDEVGGLESVPQLQKSHHGDHVQGQCCMHIAAWLPILPTEVTVEMSQREKLHGLVQLVVTSLWRSRIASEAASDGAQEVATGSDMVDSGDAAKVLPALYLIFADGTVARLTQRRLAVAMANQHMAAPSEYQILQMMVQLLQEPDVLVRVLLSAKESAQRSQWTDVLSLVLPAGLHKSERKAVRVVVITDTSSVCYACSSSLTPSDRQGHSSTTLPQVDNSICKHAYADHCTCGGSSGSDDSHSAGGSGRGSLRQHVVVLLNNPLDGLEEALHTSLFQYVYPDKPLPTSEEKLAKKAGSMVFYGPLQSCFGAVGATGRVFAPSAVVTVLQHFAYHDRLYPAIEQAIAEATS